ncbi:flagellin modification protein A [Gammaproteobacteria bacterium 42_54_T18]|nr:flagellin modification protein A [Gammaproteobacteria bacterium 42_54_T18]
MLKNNKILVVGAGGLLGARVVLSALEQNADVVAVDINLERMRARLTEQGINIENKKLETKKLDITNEGDVKEFFKHQIELSGAVNCSYPRNNTYGKHFFDVNLASFNDNLSLHLGSSFLLMQQCAVYFNRYKKPFSLVNISSVYGVIAPDFDIYDNTSMTMPIEYAAIKSAIIHLNKYVSKYVRDSAFRVNSVSPGGILDQQPDLFLEKYKAQTHGKGMLAMDDVIGSIIFLLSDQAQYIQGQNIVVDDGFSL